VRNEINFIYFGNKCCLHRQVSATDTVRVLEAL